MNWLSLFMQLLPTVIKLAQLAEQIFDNKPKAGQEKKAMVMGAIQAIVEGAQAISTGGQANTWKEIEKPLGIAVDIATGFIFKK